MPVFARLFRLVWGGEVDRALRPVLAVSLLGSTANAASQALVADLVPPERHEAAYASVRVASNLGVTLGPPIGGLLLLGKSWPVLFIGASVISFVTFLVALRLVPSGGDYRPQE